MPFVKRDFLTAHLRARAIFQHYDGVLGVGRGHKISAGLPAAENAIVVFVDEKVPPDRVLHGQLIPAHFQGFPVDVRVPVLSIPQGQRPPERG